METPTWFAGLGHRTVIEFPTIRRNGFSDRRDYIMD